MEALFLKVLNMSLTANWVILAVLVLRLLLKKAPRKYSYLLWAVVGFRLCCPVSFRSPVSLLSLFDFQSAGVTASGAMEYVPDNIGLMQTPAVDTGISSLSGAVNALLPAPEGLASVNPMQIVLFVGSVLWCAGMAAMAVYAVVSVLRLRYRLRSAIRLEEGVWQSGVVSSPFILGLVRPRIYLPFGLAEEELDCVLAHERCHLRRRDHLVRAFAFLLLTVHWFNPVVWLAFRLMVRDMEMSCDEKVLAQRQGGRKAYGNTLLSFAAGRKFPGPCPLAFGENDAEKRIRNVINWKKPSLRAGVAAAVVCAAAILLCAANPGQSGPFGIESYGIWVIYNPDWVYNADEVRLPLSITSSGRLAMEEDEPVTMEEVKMEDQGKFRAFQLTAENFDAGFRGRSYLWLTDDDPQSLRENNQKAWVLDNQPGSLLEGMGVYLLYQQDGSALLVFWEEPEDGFTVRGVIEVRDMGPIEMQDDPK